MRPPRYQVVWDMYRDGYALQRYDESIERWIAHSIYDERNEACAALQRVLEGFRGQ